MSTPRYLLDTNVVSDLVKNPGSGKAAARVARVGGEGLAVSIVVAAELRFGCAKKGSSRLTAQVEAVLGGLTILPLEPPADRHYGEIRAALEKAGHAIGPNDLLIAAHARALGIPLATANEREFARVPGLQVENWLA